MGTTQTFANFVEEKTFSSHRQSELDFFDRCCEHEATIPELKQSLQSKLKGHGRSTMAGHPSLVSHIAEQSTQSTVYQVPRPDSTNLPLDKAPWTYSHFPLLDMSLFSRPRPVDVRYMRGWYHHSLRHPPVPPMPFHLCCSLMLLLPLLH
jgi:hypothetical protein